MSKAVPILGALGIILTVAGVLFLNPYLLVAGIILISAAIIMFTRYTNEQLPDLPDIPDLKDAKVSKINVADLGRHMDEFLALGIPNPDYELSQEEITERGLEDTMIYEFSFPNDLELKRALPNEYTDEPVDVLLGGVVVGAIPIKRSPYVYVLVGMRGIRYMETEITGGRYKIVRNGRMELGKREYRITLTIYADA